MLTYQYFWFMLVTERTNDAQCQAFCLCSFQSLKNIQQLSDDPRSFRNQLTVFFFLVSVSCVIIKRWWHTLRIVSATCRLLFIRSVNNKTCSDVVSRSFLLKNMSVIVQTMYIYRSMVSKSLTRTSVTSPHILSRDIPAISVPSTEQSCCRFWNAVRKSCSFVKTVFKSLWTQWRHSHHKKYKYIEFL